MLMKTTQKTKLLRQWNNIKDCINTHPYARWYVSDPEAHPDCEALNNHTWRVDGWALASVIEEHIANAPDTCRCKLVGVTEARLGMNGMIVMD